MGGRIRLLGGSIVVSVALLAAAECTLRQWAPQDTRIVMERGSSLALSDPVLGHRNRPGAVALQVGPEFHVRYEISAQGLRDARLYESPPPVSPRILLLGDSFTFGYANEYQDIWPVVLEEELARRRSIVQCVKAGVPGYDTRIEALYLPEALDAYAPNLVLLVLLPNDVVTNRALGTPPGALGPPLVIGPRDKPSLHLPTLLARRLMESDTMYTWLYRVTSRQQIFRTSKDLDAAWSTTQDLLSHVARTCDARGTSLIVVSMPQQYQVLQGVRTRPVPGIDVRAIDRRLERWGAETRVPTIALLNGLIQEYASSPLPLYHTLDGHLNARGNKVVGRLLADGLLPHVQPPSLRRKVRSLHRKHEGPPRRRPTSEAFW